MRRLKYFGVYWPQMRADVHSWVSSYEKCKQNPPLPYATLFQVQINPRWGQHIINYLQNRQVPEKVNKRRQKAIEKKALDFTIIGNQLYKRGKDHQLWLCTNEKEFLPILHSKWSFLSKNHGQGHPNVRNLVTNTLSRRSC